jgi:hexokinase
VVAAADVDADVVTDLLAPAARVSAVRVAADVARRQVASFHVATDGPDYSWYDATELDVVVDLLD